MISLKEVEKKLRDQTIEEGPNIEFKRNIPKNLVSIAKVVAGMANTDGGFILFGIHESVKGISVIGVDCIQLKLISLKLRNYFGSQPYKVGTIKVDGKTVLYIQVKKQIILSIFKVVLILKDYLNINESVQLQVLQIKMKTKTKAKSLQNYIKRYINI